MDVELPLDPVRPTPALRSSFLSMPLFSKRSGVTDWPKRAVSLTTYNDSDDPDNEYVTPTPTPNDVPPPIEQLLVNHLRFAHAFRKNDAAMILQFLAKDVTLLSMDGARHDGQSAVLACLVGARMTKLSSNLRVKGFPTRSGTCQSTFIYEHGIVFKDPLYMEVLDWKPDGTSVARIAHVPLLSDAKKSKTLQEFGKVSPRRLSQGTRRSSMDEREENEDDGLSLTSRESDNSLTVKTDRQCGLTDGISRKMRCRRVKSRSSGGSSSTITAASLRLSCCSSSSSQSGANEVAVQPLAGGVVGLSARGRNSIPEIELVEISCTDLTPVRKRKTVNPFVTLQCPDTKTEWKSPVMRREPNPKWKQIPVRVPVQQTHDGVVEIALWDHSFFRSVKVARAALVESDILTDDAEFSATVQLERYDVGRTGGEPQYVTMKFRFVRRDRGDMAVRSSDEVEQRPARYEEAEPGKTQQQAGVGGSVLDNSLKWLVVHPNTNGGHAGGLAMLFRAAVFAAIVWMLYHVTTMWPKQVL
uniref:C2 domain-containing protein n=1 Tax=Hyaloperonospora arabidopsidis (strain Emoy2) TaxID=559515 RepID=M4BSI8_HYAAE